MTTTDPEFNPSCSEQVQAIKDATIVYENAIRANSPKGRRQAVALTHLETAAMFAVKSVFEP